jgi:alanine-glyoxylate transaminase/serine-glyoxylate transaminase/serine-pyruvate transaminase
MDTLFPKLPERLLLGPGPSNVHPRVLEAMSRPLIGHLDPAFLSLMNQTQELLRAVFQTNNLMTLPLSGTGSSGMEAAITNFIAPGTSILVAINGVFGGRIKDCAERAGAVVTTVEAPFGKPLDPNEVADTAAACRPRVIAVVHAETSTGVLQPLKPFREICDRQDALLLVDAVTSLAGHPVGVDAHGIDICYSGTQKCLSCPPGLSPFTASDRAMERLVEKCQSWYLDLRMLGAYWGKKRTYHHTAPISMNYALREALAIILEEGLERRWERHRLHHKALVAGLDAMGIDMYVTPEFRLYTLNTVTIPDGVDDLAIRRRLLENFNIEIGGGLGALAGKVWRVGLMGESSKPNYVLYFLHALGACLRDTDYRCSPGAGVAAAAEALSGV